MLTELEKFRKHKKRVEKKLRVLDRERKKLRKNLRKKRTHKSIFLF